MVTSERLTHFWFKQSLACLAPFEPLFVFPTFIRLKLTTVTMLVVLIFTSELCKKNLVGYDLALHLRLPGYLSVMFLCLYLKQMASMDDTWRNLMLDDYAFAVPLACLLWYVNSCTDKLSTQHCPNLYLVICLSVSVPRVILPDTFL